MLEIGAFHSIRTRDIPSFDRFFSQLQTYYTDYTTVLPPSPRQFPLQGLNLIRLLTQNRIADFHTTLEGLPADIPQDNPFIRHPVNLERWMMEGSYSKVWNARSEAPAEEYKLFVESLMGTIRFVAGFAGYGRERLIYVHTGTRLLAVKKRRITVSLSTTL
jgi:26S proteasome regulatory subunit N12